jgi:AcrR family transcriptional regulator
MNLRDEQAASTRALVVDAARDLFTRLGFGAVGIREIAAAAGTSTGAVFHKWASKEALFEEVMGHDWPDPAAFARFVLSCKTIEEASKGAAVFLGAVAGESLHGKNWSPAKR